MTNNEKLDDFLLDFKAYIGFEDEKDKTKYLNKIKKEYVEYPGILDLFKDTELFSVDYVNRLYETINELIFIKKLLYNDIIQEYKINHAKYNGTIKNENYDILVKFLLDTIDNIPIESPSSDDCSSNPGDIDDDIFFDCLDKDDKPFIFKPNQIRGIEETLKQNFASGIHSQATGTGKTIMMLKIMWLRHQQYPEEHMIWFCERKDIPKKIFFDKNNVEFYKKNDIIDLSHFVLIDFINDKPKDLNPYMMDRKNREKPFIIVINRAFATSKSTYWKLDPKKLYKYQEIIGKFTPKFIAFDECHSSMAPKTYEFLQYAKNIWKSNIQGMSATPYRKGGSNVVSLDGLTEKVDNRQKLLNIFNKEDNINELNVISWCNIKEAIEEEYILEPVFHWFSINNYYSKSKSNDNENEINSVYSVLNETLDNCPYKKVIVWCKIINNTQDWFNNFEKNRDKYPNLSNMKFYIDHSKIDEEYSKYDEFYNEQGHAIMFCANKYREGSDIPYLDCELFLDKVKDRTEIVYIQSIGRVLRKDINRLKRNGHIIDSFVSDDDTKKIRDIVTKILKYYFDLYEISFNTKNTDFSIKSHVFNEILKNLKIEPEKKEISILLNNNKKITIDLAKIDISTLEWSTLMKEFKNVLTFEFEFTEEDEFNELKKKVIPYGFKTAEEYKSNVEKYDFDVYEPNIKYERLWNGWYDFLGVDTSIYFKSLNEWINEIKKIDNLHTFNDYYEICMSGKYPNLALYPDELYKRQGFISLPYYFDLNNNKSVSRNRR